MSDINYSVLLSLHDLIQNLYYDFEDMKWDAIAFEEYLNDNGIFFDENGTHLFKFMTDISSYTPSFLSNFVRKQDNGPFGVYYIVEERIGNSTSTASLIIPEDIVLLFNKENKIK